MPSMACLLQLKIRHNDPVNVYAVHSDNPNSRAAESPASSLGWLGEEQKKGNEEVTYDKKDGEPVPATGVSINEEPCFLRNICIPLKKILAKGDVPPERGKSEKQHSHNVIVLHCEKALQMSRANKPIGYENENCHR